MFNDKQISHYESLLNMMMCKKCCTTIITARQNPAGRDRPAIDSCFKPLEVLISFFGSPT